MTRWEAFWCRFLTISTLRGDVCLWPWPRAVTEELLTAWPPEYEMWKRIVIGCSREDWTRGERAFVWSRRFWSLTYWSVAGRFYRAMKRRGWFVVAEGDYYRNGHFVWPFRRKGMV